MSCDDCNKLTLSSAIFAALRGIPSPITLKGRGVLLTFQKAISTTLAIALLGIFLAQKLRAGDVYIETGVGASQIRRASQMFSGMTDTPDVGLALNAMVGWNLMSPGSTLQIHIGVQDRFLTSYENGTPHGMHSIYPIVRFELPRLYLGVGATPFVFKNSGDPYSLSYQQETSALAVIGELGLLWRVVPYFHFSIGASVQAAQNVGGIYPFPAADVTAQMRFMLGVGENRQEAAKRHHDGWRYPFGIEIR